MDIIHVLLVFCKPLIHSGNISFSKDEITVSDVLHFSFELLTPCRNAEVDAAVKLMHNHYAKTYADYTLMIY